MIPATPVWVPASSCGILDGLLVAGAVDRDSDTGRPASDSRGHHGPSEQDPTRAAPPPPFGDGGKVPGTVMRSERDTPDRVDRGHLHRRIDL
ncbi:hypothetical protein BJP25_28960 [Actinokineospora bangkokensis]|uniref:Uncharacterized protein n=1 Tax=Actinokineospora bangkokensis TaxID=1193682 RepID=A0A1Q9LF52_9PSEU|nr:hypothetical protein BJP25_28960 [Actinokineospora bangkokensis]